MALRFIASVGRVFAALRLPGRTRVVLQSLRSLLGPGDRIRQSLVALALNSLTSLVAGVFLGAITGTFDRLPGLLILVPAAIGLRGNVFSAFGNRLSTAIHTGQFELTWRRGSVLAQNALAALILTMALSVALAVLAKVVAVAIGVEGSVSLLTLVMISVVGGLLASIIVLAASVGLAWAAVCYDWDLDNVVAPVVSTLGDVLTLPALWLASLLVPVRFVVPVVGSLLGIAALAAFVAGVLARQSILRQVTRESWPVLLGAAGLSILAGLVLEQRLSVLAAFPVLLVLQPAFVSSAGALGGILSSRLSSNLHLGLVTPTRVPSHQVRRDALSTLLIGFPVYLFNALGAFVAAQMAGLATVTWPVLLAITLIAGLVTVLFVLAVAYFGTVAAVVVRVDPDTYGIPLVTSAADFVGSVALVAVAVVFGVGAV